MKNDNTFGLIDFIYRTIAEYFVCDDKDLGGWICYNCNNDNFKTCIGGEMIKRDKCSLCGMKQVESIALKIRNRDTFTAVNKKDKITNEIKDEIKDNEQKDSIRKLIVEAIDTTNISLCCPNRNDESACPAIWRLAKILIKYKRWIKEIYKKASDIKGDIDTINVNVRKLNNDMFIAIVLRSARCINKINEGNINMLQNAMDKNIDNMSEIQTFLKTNIKAFAAYLKQNANVKLAAAAKLYRKIRTQLLHKAQQMQFGDFISKVNIDDIERDYHHILQIHICNNNATYAQNTYKFFGKVIHYDDAPSEIEKCLSFHRRETRTKQMRLQNKDTENNVNFNQSMATLVDENTWTLEQHYIQSQLDVIHSSLVHSTLQRQQYDSDEKKEIQQDDEELNNKFISAGAAVEYGFGIIHEYHRLSPTFASIYEEMMRNKYINEKSFHISLITAIKKHQIAVSKYKEQLISKYFQKEYNIPRNQAISIRHILVICLYTDISEFCTNFRRTYRKINQDETLTSVTSRHEKLYFFSRALFESIDIFGQTMSGGLYVYHGLMEKMVFKKFRAYFNMPISTTTSFKAAQQFSQGVGIIMTLKAVVPTNNANPSKVPKYLDVSWLSSFQSEREKLFSGSNAFQIINIHCVDKTEWKGHKNELSVFNEFQKTIQNQTSEWNTKTIKRLKR
eukprot:344891_1